jgi:hypothetical protein
MEKCKEYRLTMKHIKDLKYTFNPPFYKKKHNKWKYKIIEPFTDEYIPLAKYFLDKFDIIDKKGSVFIENNLDRYFIKNLCLAIIHEISFRRIDDYQKYMIYSDFLKSQVLENILIYENKYNKIIHTPNSGDVYNTKTGELYEVKSNIRGCRNIKKNILTKGVVQETGYHVSHCIYYTEYTKIISEYGNTYTFCYVKRNLNTENEEDLEINIDNIFGKIYLGIKILENMNIIQKSFFDNVIQLF